MDAVLSVLIRMPPFQEELRGRPAASLGVLEAERLQREALTGLGLIQLFRPFGMRAVWICFRRGELQVAVEGRF